VAVFVGGCGVSDVVGVGWLVGVSVEGGGVSVGVTGNREVTVPVGGRGVVDAVGVRVGWRVDVSVGAADDGDVTVPVGGCGVVDAVGVRVGWRVGVSVGGGVSVGVADDGGMTVDVAGWGVSVAAGKESEVDVAAPVNWAMAVGVGVGSPVSRPTEIEATAATTNSPLMSRRRFLRRLSSSSNQSRYDMWPCYIQSLLCAIQLSISTFCQALISNMRRNFSGSAWESCLKVLMPISRSFR